MRECGDTRNVVSLIEDLLVVERVGTRDAPGKAVKDLRDSYSPSPWTNRRIKMLDLMKLI
jgi:hypothetical protein